MAPYTMSNYTQQDVDVLRDNFGGFRVRCRLGHWYAVPMVDVENARERVSLLGYDRLERLSTIDIARALPCTVCAALERATMIAAFEDPDRLRIDGLAE